MTRSRISPDKMPILPSKPVPQRCRARVLRYIFWSFCAVALLAASLLRWGSHLLISDEPLSLPVDRAVVLQGSVLGEKARVAGAVRLLRQGATNRILLSVPQETYWGQPVAPIAYANIEKIYGAETARRVDFCETKNVDSTEEEAKALVSCIQDHGWHSITVVTSDYHTRRAGIIWRRTLRQQHASVQLWIHAVADPEFRASGWWRDRQSAKTGLMEAMKLLWTLAGQ